MAAAASRSFRLLFYTPIMRRIGKPLVERQQEHMTRLDFLHILKQVLGSGTY
jgi:hypothetical protein